MSSAKKFSKKILGGIYCTVLSISYYLRHFYATGLLKFDGSYIGPHQCGLGLKKQDVNTETCVLTCRAQPMLQPDGSTKYCVEKEETREELT